MAKRLNLKASSHPHTLFTSLKSKQLFSAAGSRVCKSGLEVVAMTMKGCPTSAKPLSSLLTSSI
ncbi:hypothetical protein CK203_054128 [Vitis vinifera]|uniref:Uncharacterized protein n=1 Tax=Vitis vinifera TaxID=29760 RepID=A0A438H6S1_VITVI|nr:hypothetical protein CK203_054128 [Vitis vinifera]